MTEQLALAEMGVSRETIGCLDRYVSILKKWNAHINLVSRSSIDDIWNRHIVDCFQLLKIAHPTFQHWLDLGSGGGFPGLVVAIALRGHESKRTTLVESDVRKCSFLTSVIKELNLNATVRNSRIERLDPQQADVLSARALAPLDKLLYFSERHRRPDGLCLFPKGENVAIELTSAQKNWNVTPIYHPSQTNPKSCILEIGHFHRVE